MQFIVGMIVGIILMLPLAIKLTPKQDRGRGLGRRMKDVMELEGEIKRLEKNI